MEACLQEVKELVVLYFMVQIDYGVVARCYLKWEEEISEVSTTYTQAKVR